MYQIKEIKISELQSNIGQIDGLAENPRKWTPQDLENMKKSLTETPELLEARPLIVIRNGKKYVVLGGNLRFEALKKMKGTAKTVPCMVLDDGMTPQKLREFVMKDNSSFGKWDVDELANLWDSYPLEDWGVKIAIDTTEEYSGKNTEIDTDEWTDEQTMRFKFTPEELDYVNARLGFGDPRKQILELLGYEQ